MSDQSKNCQIFSPVLMISLAKMSDHTKFQSDICPFGPANVRWQAVIIPSALSLFSYQYLHPTLLLPFFLHQPSPSLSLFSSQYLPPFFFHQSPHSLSLFSSQYLYPTLLLPFFLHQPSPSLSLFSSQYLPPFFFHQSPHSLSLFSSQYLPPFFFHQPSPSLSLTSSQYLHPTLLLPPTISLPLPYQFSISTSHPPSSTNHLTPSPFSVLYIYIPPSFFLSSSSPFCIYIPLFYLPPPHSITPSFPLLEGQPPFFDLDTQDGQNAFDLGHQRKGNNSSLVL